LLAASGQTVRAEGVAAASVAEIASRVGLTHGAVYRQFSSKDGLVAASITADFDRIVALLEGIGAKGGSLEAYFRAYLATDHRDHFPWGCPVAPLAAEVGRSSEPVRQAFAEGLQRNLDAIAELSRIPDRNAAQAFAISTLATLSGAMAMARSTRAAAPETSDLILQVALAGLLANARSAGAAD
jgi:TetR/AcrR family transcriptional regulator, transcriptional repressor for nem operon